VVVTEPFERVARSSAEARGASKLPIVVLPAKLDDLADVEIAAIVSERFFELRDALVRHAR
jgi:hypothetical protein